MKVPRGTRGSQKAAVAVELLPVYEAEARERMLAGVKVESADPSQNFDQGATKGKATAQAAQAIGANRQYVADAKKIKAQDETLKFGRYPAIISTVLSSC